MRDHRSDIRNRSFPFNGDDHPRARIVWVDDNAGMPDAIAHVLSPRFEVETRSDGQAAWERIQAMQKEERPPDLVVSDVMKLRLDGFSLLHKLRADPTLAAIPIIVLSARAGEEAGVGGIEAGADDYLIRPFTARELLIKMQAQITIAGIRRKADRAIRDSEQHFRSTADAAPAMLWVTKPDGSCSFLSRGWYEFSGQNEQEGCGFGWLQAVHPDDQEASGRIFLEANRRQEAFTLDYRLRRADGKYRWCLDAGRPRFDVHGAFLGYVGSVIDITERKQAEVRLEQFAEELERQVTARTVELRESEARLRALASELNRAEQHERKRIATELHDYLQQALVLGKWKLKQVKQLVTPIPKAAKIAEEADAVLSDTLVYTRTLIAELSPPVLRDHGLTAGLKWLGTYMNKYGMTVSVTAPPEECFKLSEDQVGLLFQSVRELLLNCSLHAETRQAALSLDASADSLLIEVRDEGTGFDFTEFDELNGETSKKIGLFSIRERMRAMGGSFTIRSAPKQGTTATLTLPLATMSSSSCELSVGRAPIADHSVGTMIQHPKTPAAIVRVLLVDDHAMVRQGLRSVLDSYEDIQIVGEAQDGAEAVRLVEELRPRVVVMDINMPKMNGIEATARIKATWPDTSVVGISVNAGGENSEAMKRAGAAMLLTKDAAVEQLYDAIMESVG